jgi:phosphoribosylamine--glycine ligase
MRILVIGSGGREHTIIWKLKAEDKVKEIYCAPGNAGISRIAECVNIGDNEIERLSNFALTNNIDLTIVGPEVPLVNGIVDKFQALGLKIFGPNKQCAQLEGSKSFSKDFMIRHNIPTAKYGEYIDINGAIKDIDNFGYPVVLKADGLAAGKGVVIAQNREEALNTLKEMMEEKKFGEAGNKVVIEEYLSGIETSILAFVDSDTIVPMVSAKDHKRIYDNEEGPNTGGMGTFSPSSIYTEELSSIIKEQVLQRTLDGLKKDKLNYKGVIFIGLMMTNDGPKVLEYNVRFGDPETQVVLTRLKTNLTDIIDSILNNNLKNIDIKYEDCATVCVMLTSKGYPDNYEKGKIISGTDSVEEDIMIFHSGTKLVNDNLVTNGGRVIGITAKGKTLEEATEKAYKNVAKVKFEGAHYRNDIGLK